MPSVALRPYLALVACVAAVGCSKASAEAARRTPSEPAYIDVEPTLVESDPDPTAEGVERRGFETRIYARTRFVWVRHDPSIASGWLGFLWLGGSVLARAEDATVGDGCEGGKWYPIEPRGWVCANGVDATLDAADSLVVASKAIAPDLSSPWPHHYGESRMVERYQELPTLDEQFEREPDLGDHLARVGIARSLGETLGGADVDMSADARFELPALPFTLRETRKRIFLGSTVAWSRELDANDRTWLLSSDLVWMPKDRVVPFARSPFHGFELGDGTELPIAYFRERSRLKHAFAPDGHAEATGDSWPRLAWVGLTGRVRSDDGVVYRETTDRGAWVDERDAVVLEPTNETPWHEPVDRAPRAPGDRARPRRTWVEVSVLGGWLIAYEDRHPVYVTMISPGRGGMPVPGADLVDTASTPIGIYRVNGKFATATMVTSETLIHSDVPWVQNFHGPHAIHAAYWHDAWGEKKSGGCINLAPIDAKWLFEWSEPHLPPGWHGVRTDAGLGEGTMVVVHR